MLCLRFILQRESLTDTGHQDFRDDGTKTCGRIGIDTHVDDPSFLILHSEDDWERRVQGHTTTREKDLTKYRQKSPNMTFGGV